MRWLRAVREVHAFAMPPGDEGPSPNKPAYWPFSPKPPFMAYSEACLVTAKIFEIFN